MKKLLVMVGTVALTAGLANANDCRHEAPRQQSLAVGNARLVSIDAVAGSLRVEGRPGLTEVRARGTACSSSRSMLDQIRLEVRRSGDRIVVVADVPSSRLFSNARLDLIIEVPAGIAVDIDDGSGSMIVRGTGTLNIRDGSGDIEVSDIRGDVTIDDGSGSMEIHDVQGTVRLDDGSGDIDVREIRGSVIVDDDGSGDIEIRRVSLDVLVRDDGSGSIRVYDVQGKFTVLDDGSGGVDYGNIRGPVRIRD